MSLHQQELEQDTLKTKRKNKMASTNTEKPMGKAQKAKVAPVKTQKKTEIKAPVKTKKPEVTKVIKEKTTEKEAKENKEKKKVKVQPKVKKNEVSVNAKSVTASTKVSMALCKFIKRKTIPQAIKDLEEVIKLRKAVPMKGEIPHRKGKIMSGRFPERAAKEFLILVKSLEGNANNFDVENPIIAVAIANKAQRPFAKGGRARKKRTHISLVAREKKINKTQNKKQ